MASEIGNIDVRPLQTHGAPRKPEATCAGPAKGLRRSERQGEGAGRGQSEVLTCCLPQFDWFWYAPREANCTALILTQLKAHGKDVTLCTIECQGSDAKKWTSFRRRETNAMTTTVTLQQARRTREPCRPERLWAWVCSHGVNVTPQSCQDKQENESV